MQTLRLASCLDQTRWSAYHAISDEFPATFKKCAHLLRKSVVNTKLNLQVPYEYHTCQFTEQNEKYKADLP